MKGTGKERRKEGGRGGSERKNGKGTRKRKQNK